MAARERRSQNRLYGDVRLMPTCGGSSAHYGLGGWTPRADPGRLVAMRKRARSTARREPIEFEGRFCGHPQARGGGTRSRVRGEARKSPLSRARRALWRRRADRRGRARDSRRVVHVGRESTPGTAARPPAKSAQLRLAPCELLGRIPRARRDRRYRRPTSRGRRRRRCADHRAALRRAAPHRA